MEERSVFLDIVSEHLWDVCAFADRNPFRAFAASLDGALSPMVGPGYVLLSQQFNVSVDNITSSFGFILLGLGTFMYARHFLYSHVVSNHLYSQAGPECSRREVRTQDRLLAIRVSGM